jgi:ABC-type spermidine/putrescine transport system permease subunit II
MYSAGFGVSLLGLTLVTTLIILAVTSNIILSLGMVGALSIARFRTAIKEPLDIVFLFWSIATGIVLGAGLLPLAVLGSLFIGIILVVFVNRKSVDSPYILIVGSGENGREEDILNLFSRV